MAGGQIMRKITSCSTGRKIKSSPIKHHKFYDTTTLNKKIRIYAPKATKAGQPHRQRCGVNREAKNNLLIEI